MSNPNSPKHIRRQEQAKKMEATLAGTGRYVFENRTSGDLLLPKLSLDKKKTILKGAQFVGDSYFFKMVPRELFFIKEEIVEQKVLLTEQPPIITEEGRVEYVEENSAEQLLESQEKKKPKPKLLNEPGNGGVKIIR